MGEAMGDGLKNALRDAFFKLGPVERTALANVLLTIRAPAVAAKWWEDRPDHPRHGFVVVKVIPEWIENLSEPEVFVPGVHAVDFYGRQWVATGGDGQQGAREWVPFEKPAEGSNAHYSGEGASHAA
ncbi:MAG: hypothetical protein CME38_18875 [Haliea sp.]|nr:hypothetical protein [Haliea sp.]|tara:strand:- start:194 stop:574 length:381 start_codon:yes stop_codon:yes gene_type:complete